MVKHCALIAIFYGAVVIDDYPLSRVKIISIRSDHVRRATAHHAFEMKLKYKTIDKNLLRLHLFSSSAISILVL